MLPIAERARSLPWGKERPWHPDTHMWEEAGLTTIDLHDLSVRLGLEVVDALEELGAELPSGAVMLITGRGKHTMGRSTLRDAVADALIDAAQRHGWRVFPRGPARFVLITDEARAPASATGKPGLLMVLFALLVLVALLVSWFNWLVTP